MRQSNRADCINALPNVCMRPCGNSRPSTRQRRSSVQLCVLCPRTQAALHRRACQAALMCTCATCAVDRSCDSRTFFIPQGHFVLWRAGSESPGDSVERMSGNESPSATRSVKRPPPLASIVRETRFTQVEVQKLYQCYKQVTLCAFGLVNTSISDVSSGRYEQDRSAGDLLGCISVRRQVGRALLYECDFRLAMCHVG